MTVVDIERQLARAWQVRQAHFPMEIEFDYPLNTVAISLTGTECALDCAHCGGHYLQSMAPVWRVEAKGAIIGIDHQARRGVLCHTPKWGQVVKLTYGFQDSDC